MNNLYLVSWKYEINGFYKTFFRHKIKKNSVIRYQDDVPFIGKEKEIKDFIKESSDLMLKQLKEKIKEEGNITLIDLDYIIDKRFDTIESCHVFNDSIEYRPATIDECKKILSPREFERIYKFVE